MNQLNAIIVERTVEDAVQFTEQIVTSVFTIKTEMIFKDRIGEQKTKVFYFPIQCEGHLARFCQGTTKRRDKTSCSWSPYSVGKSDYDFR